MFCTGRPSIFETISPFEMIPQWGSQGRRCGGGGPRRGFGHWGVQPRSFSPCSGQLREILQNVNGHRSGCHGPWGSERPGCLDHSGHRHCQTHCLEQCNPGTLLEQFIIEDIISDKHQNQAGESIQASKNKGSETEEIRINKTSNKETDSNSQVENSAQSHPGEIVTPPSKPWSVVVDMNGCNEVRAWTEDGKIMVEGHTRNAHGFTSVKRAMTLPSHVRVEALKATIGEEGKLTLSEARENKDNKAMDIPVQSEENLQIPSKEQTVDKDVQENSVDQESPEVNMNESDPENKLNT